MGEKGIVYHRLNFDRTEKNWADQLLRIEMGFREPWTPKITYGIFPNGLKGFRKKLVVYHARTMLVFEKTLGADGDQVLRCANAPVYTMQRQDQYLVLTRRADRRWYYETADFGESWRVGKMEFVKQPGLFTTVEYENDNNIRAVHYPNGETVKLEYGASGLPKAIIQPDGERIRLERDGNNYIVSVDVIRTIKGKETLVEQHRYENRIGGKIHRFFDSAGREFRIEYSKAKIDGADAFTTMIHNIADKTYTYQRHTVSQAGDWLIEKGSAKAGVSVSDAENASVTKMVKTHYAYRTVSKAYSEQLPPETLRYDSRGRLAVVVDSTGQETRYRYDENGYRSAVDYADGTRSTYRYNSLGQLLERTNRHGDKVEQKYDAQHRLASIRASDGREVHYRYDTHGGLEKTIKDGVEHQFQTDNLGRIVAHYLPNRTAIRWSYDRHHLTQKTLFSVDAPKVALNSEHYNYDLKGRLINVVVDNKRRDTFKYNCCSLLSHTDQYGVQTLYRYDAAGRMILKQAPSFKEYYRYDIYNRLIAKRRKVKGTWQTTHLHYNDSGEFLAESINDEPPERYFSDSIGHIYRTVYPDDSYDAHLYGEDGKLLSQRGSHQSFITVYQHDTRGRVVSEVEIPTTANNALRVTRYEYDERGNRIAVHHPTGMIERRTYNDANQMVMQYLGKDSIRRYVYNITGQLIEIYRGPSEDSLSLWEKRTYTAHGNIRDVYSATARYGKIDTDGLRLSRRYHYDLQGNFVRVSYPKSRKKRVKRIKG